MRSSNPSTTQAMRQPTRWMRYTVNGTSSNPPTDAPEAFRATAVARWWNRLCGTYRAQPALGQVGMDIGLSEYRAPLHLGQLLLVPLCTRTGHATHAGARAAYLQERDAA